MPSYLLQFHKETFELMEGRYVVFHDMYAFVDRNQHSRYKIKDMTLDLTGREHFGNAKQDVFDLYNCYYELYDKVYIKLEANEKDAIYYDSYKSDS